MVSDRTPEPDGSPQPPPDGSSLPLDDEPDAAGLLTDTTAPLARGSLLAALVAIIAGWLFLPQVPGLALAGLSLARREPHGRRLALGGIGLNVALTVLWALALGALASWWAATQLE